MSDPSPSERGQELHLLLAMSSELAQTTDPAETGDLIARHIARATGLDECAVSYWDRAADTVITYGYYPPERRAALELCYRLADYPETRRVLETQEHSVIDVEDRAPIGTRWSTSERSGTACRRCCRWSRSARPWPRRARDRRARHVRRHPPGARTVDGQRGRDPLENSRLYEALRRQALHDPLTGLANRTLFQIVSSTPWSGSERDGSQVAVLFLDMDDFKMVNDGLGHLAGDRLLTDVAGRLRAMPPAGRYGGSPGRRRVRRAPGRRPGRARQVSIAERLLESGRPDPARGTGRGRAGSVGVALGTSASLGVDELLRNADFAMYQAKSRARDASSCSSREMRNVAVRRADFLTQLRGAWSVASSGSPTSRSSSCATGRVDGLEALVRWQHPERGVVCPASSSVSPRRPA